MTARNRRELRDNYQDKYYKKAIKIAKSIEILRAKQTEVYLEYKERLAKLYEKEG